MPPEINVNVFVEDIIRLSFVKNWAFTLFTVILNVTVFPFDVKIDVPLPNVAVPEYVNAMEELNVILPKKAKVDVPNKDEIIISLDLLLGLGKDEGGLHWAYLNKGTHEEEDREEFDHITVKEIIESLERIDSSLL